MSTTLNQMKCNGRLPRFAVVLLAAVTVAAPRALADSLGTNGRAVFRLDVESAFEWGCLPPCLCPFIHIDDLKGTMEFIYTGFDGLVDTYRVLDVNWAVAVPDGSLRVTGEGRYSIGSPSPQLVIEHRMELDLALGEAPVQHFDSGWVPVEQIGGIHITVSMNDMNCYDAVFILHASRVPDNEIVPYALGAGSTFQRGCWDPCDCPLGLELPMIGTFGLVPMQNDTTLGAEFAVVRINWNVLASNVTDGVPIKGAGKYRVEPDIMRQEMGLSLIVGDEPRARFGSGDVPLGVPPPAIDVVVSMNGMVCYDTVLHIVAEPVDDRVCGGIAGIPCNNGEFCKLPLGACGCDHMGVCVPIPTDCPAVWVPVCGCDGVTYGNECEADKAGVTIRHLGECETVCGGWAGDTCEEGEFCKYLTGVCNDWADASGVCTPIPNACPEIYDPVCGCDGVTYDNECFADAASMSILHHGPCTPIGACCLDIDRGPIAYDTCLHMSEEDCKKKGGIFAGSSAACEATEACCFASVEGCADLHPFCCLASGGIPQGPGSTCHPVPQFCGGIANIPCPDGFVCVDDPTDNCDPDAGGADCPGICVPEPPCGEVCGGIQGIPCTEPDEFCKLPVGHCCCDFFGICTPIPDACPENVDPVCGCDGVTYSNECCADMAGMSIDYRGECKPVYCWSNEMCNPNEYCFFHACAAETGVCMPRPETCPDLWEPVCGCDGITYPNRCEAARAGMSVDYYGECERVCSRTDPNLRCDPDEFCKFPPGTCDDASVLGICVVVPSDCPEVWEPVCGCDGVTYANVCFADMSRVSINFFRECEACAATRALADPEHTYCPGVPKRVQIHLSPGGAKALALEDTPPVGWEVTVISNDGIYDEVNGKVKWGPFFGGSTPRSVSYEVVAPMDEDGVVCFEGTVSLDGINEPICGDECTEPHCIPAMAADTPQPPCPTCPIGDCTTCPEHGCRDGRITICELIGYACAWLRGCNDDLAGVTRAAYIWRHGECYCWEEDRQNWFPTPCPPPGSGLCGAMNLGASVGDGRDAGDANSGDVVAYVRPPRNHRQSRDRGFEVAVTIDAPEQTSAIALGLSIPKGLTPTDISDGGAWDEIHRKVKWGPFYDNLSRTVTCKGRRHAGSVSSPARRVPRKPRFDGFSGTVSFDGINHPIVVK